MRKFLFLSLGELTNKCVGYSALIFLGIAVLICGLIVILKKTKIESDIGVGLIFISLVLIIFGTVKLCCQ